ncbi:MAG: class I SAM-dependent methyltransferase [Myxococcota bacterium]
MTISISRARKTIYELGHRTMISQSNLAQRVLRSLIGINEIPPQSTIDEVERRIQALLQRDLSNVEAGYYPESLLTQMPVLEYLSRAPEMILDLPRVIRRMQSNDYKDLPEQVPLEGYPPYYRRTFHWQTGGYLSRHSARIYDLSVEFLFAGLADVMRRQIIPPLHEALRSSQASSDRPRRLLDVACGTGRTLSQIRLALPETRLYGIDLSPYYLDESRSKLDASISLTAGNAEEMPYRDDYFDAVSCVYLFHELPRNARRKVLGEILRILRPGGTLVVEDSAQLAESAELVHAFEGFSRDFHEPFYQDYVRDNLDELVEECGFELVSSEPHYVAKVVVARKVQPN